MIKIKELFYLAYIDPGSGAFIVQICIAFFVGLTFTFRRVRQKIAAFFNRENKNDPR